MRCDDLVACRVSGGDSQHMRVLAVSGTAGSMKWYGHRKEAGRRGSSLRVQLTLARAACACSLRVQLAHAFCCGQHARAF